MSMIAKKMGDQSLDEGKYSGSAPPMQDLDPDKIKVLVNTSFTRPSGERGVPMFSRIGKQTAVEILEFHGESKIQVDSTAVQKKKADDAAKKAMEEDVLDQETKNDFKTVNNMIENQRKMQQQGQSETKQARAPGGQFPTQFDNLDDVSVTSVSFVYFFTFLAIAILLRPRGSCHEGQSHRGKGSGKKNKER